MLKVLEQATVAARQGNWSLLNQCLQQLPLGNAAVSPLTDSDLEQALNLALSVLDAGDFQERWDVAKVFPKLGKVAIAPLIELLEDEEAELEARWFAGRILGNFDDASVVTRLVNVLHTSTDSELTAMAATALANFGTRAIEGLTPLLEKPESRVLAVRSLSQIRHSQTIPPLLGVVDDPDITVRLTAIESLSSFHDSRIPPLLLKALKDSSAAVRKEAVTGLGLRADLQEELDLLNGIKPLLYDFNAEVCAAAAIALGRLGTSEATAALFAVLKSPATPMPLQIAFIRALAWVETAQTLEYLQQVLSWSLEEPALEIIGVLGRLDSPTLKPKAAQILIDFFNSQHPIAKLTAVKQALALAWGELGELEATNALITQLAEPTTSVRLHAIAALKKLDAYPKLQQLASDNNLAPELKQGVAIALAEWSVK
ncbi:MAG: HEAT repeat domain-containing protein [Kastovskya adunca ATA6-11-RM4]|nr:HEAT repeat domain-containing protein [Kastovskya adunca ATA6-11-RM4]